MIDCIYNSKGDPSKCPDILIRDFLHTWGELSQAMNKYPDMPYTEAYERFKMELAEWTVHQKSRGAGDTIAKVTHATGLDKLSELYTKITGKPCGCKDRQEALNKLVPYGVKEDV